MSAKFFGQYLLNNNIIEPIHLAKAIEFQEKTNMKIGQLLKTKNLLTEEQIKEVIDYQREKNIFFGEAAQSLGLVTKQQIDEALQEQKNSHIYLGDALVKLGYLTEAEKNQALEGFIKEQEAVCLAKSRNIYPEELKNEGHIIEKFIDLSIELLNRMGGIVAKLDNFQYKKNEIILTPISIRMGFIGLLSERISQYLLLTVRQVAVKIAVNMFAMEESELEEGLVEDAVAEMVNLICGHACNQLSGIEDKHLKITIPERRFYKQGESRYTLKANEKAVIVKLLTPIGDISFVLIFKD